MSLENLRKELVESAAVAVAIVEALDTGSTNRDRTADVLAEVIAERARQEEKWGSQSHSPGYWIAVLMEEVGEAAAEIESRFEGRETFDIVGRVSRLGLEVRALLNAGVLEDGPPCPHCHGPNDHGRDCLPASQGGTLDDPIVRSFR